MTMEITALYAALLGLLFIVLSFRVSKHRLAGHVSLGDGDNPDLAQAIRAHGNFAEYVPLALILMGLAEAQGAAAGLLHALGAGLLLGRIAHAWGISQPNAVHNARKLGIVLTWLSIAVASVYLLLAVLR
ncbi:MAG TPA: MAPEG family protein [Xanthomonadales bacterium]|nr:MAPEG family protein [Xanthomonadales bacterium]